MCSSEHLFMRRKENLRIVSEKFRGIIRDMTADLMQRTGQTEPVDNGEPPLSETNAAEEEKR